MHTGSRVIWLLMALLAAATELVSAAFGPAKATDFSSATEEVSGNPVAAAAETPALAPQTVPAPAAKISNFSISPMDLRIIAHAPLFRVIATLSADGRRMASVADANERQLLFVKITRG